MQLPDFGGHATQTIGLTPDRKPRVGAEGAVTATMEVGDDTIREQTTALKVRF